MLQSNREVLEGCGESQPSFSDPDARAMEAATRVAVDYNVRIAVDIRKNLIAEQKVHNKLSDPVFWLNRQRRRRRILRQSGLMSWPTGATASLEISKPAKQRG